MTLGELKKILAEQMEKVDDAIVEWGENEKVDIRNEWKCYGDYLLKVYTGDDENDGTIDFNDLVDTSVED